MHRASSFQRSLVVILVVVATAGCPDDEPQIDLLLDEAVSATVTPSEGGTLEATTGHRLEIPPGAVTQEVEVTLTPLGFPADPEWVVWGGAMLEPNGLVFDQPAQLTIPLSVPLEPGAGKMLAEGASVDDELVEVGTLMTVSADGLSAVGPVHGFSVKVVQQNCHAGTRDHLMEVWKQAGVLKRSAAEVATETGVTQAALAHAKKFSESSIFKLLGGYFDKCGDFPSGTDVDATALRKIKSTLAKDRQVVMLFGSPIVADPAQPKLAHSAWVVAADDGLLMVRGQLNVTGDQTFSDMKRDKKSTIVEMPLDTIDKSGGMRDIRGSELGRTYIKHEPYDRTKQPKIWSHVQIYCERPRPTADDRDGDTVPDEKDNCPDVVNEHQIDSDEDGQGNKCDTTPCPTYSVVTPPCGGPQGCIEGFYCSTETGACEQETCPPNAGRTDTLDCCCDCWTDKTMMNLRDPCRTNFVLACVPRE